MKKKQKLVSKSEKKITKKQKLVSKTKKKIKKKLKRRSKIIRYKDIAKAKSKPTK